MREGRCQEATTLMTKGSRSGGGAPEVDLVTQACKALCERSPYDGVAVEDDGNACNLPAGLVVLLRQSVGRRKRRKSHSTSVGKCKGKGGVWVETQEYFRDLKAGDIEELGRLSSVSRLVESKSFFIPVLGNGDGGIKEEENGDVMDMDVSGVVVDEDPKGSDSTSVFDPARGLEWILGYRNKDYLNTERPTRKRKRLGSEAGLEKVLIPCPCEGNAYVCNYCSTGDVWGEFNPLITCASCKVVVHKRCYGVQEAVSDSWMCSWCRQMSGEREAGTPCILCSKRGGALKPVHKTDEQNGPMEFVHLFCAQWIPEVYVDDNIRMESIMNLGEIKDVRRKLICSICKVKRGACVRCSHGSCRTSFHPICAREAGQRMEIWGKYGCDDVELRSFCSKHSEVRNRSGTPAGDNTVTASGDSPSVIDIPLTMSSDKRHSIGLRNSSKTNQHDGISESCSEKPCNNQSTESSDNSPRTAVTLDVRDVIQDQKMENLGNCGDENGSVDEPLNLALILRKDGNLVAELQSKIFQWFKSHASVGTLQRNFSGKLDPAILCKAESGVDELSDFILLESDAPNVKSVPARLRTKGRIIIRQDKKLICQSMEISGENGMKSIEINRDQLVNGGYMLRENSLCDGATENASEDERLHDSSQDKDQLAAAPNICISCGCLSQQTNIPDGNMSEGQNARNPFWLDAAYQVVNDLINTETVFGYYVHPYIHKLWDMESFPSSNQPSELDGFKEEISTAETFLTVGDRCNHQYQYTRYDGMVDISIGIELEQSVKARRVGVVEISPEDELEGEIIYLQHGLLGNAIARKQFTDNLVSEVTKRLPNEIELARRQGWDAIIANQYLCELKEANKRGRKERTHKEEQAVLDDATAAAASSSRASAIRIDFFDESVNQEAENNKYEIKESRNIKQLRAELERLRLLGERIVRREKIKLETVSCMNEILAAKRDCVGYSLLMNNTYLCREGSSESVTMSLRGHTDDYKRSDDVTVDSSVSVKPQVVDHGCMDADQRTDDSSTTQQNSLTEMSPC